MSKTQQIRCKKPIFTPNLIILVVNSCSIVVQINVPRNGEGHFQNQVFLRIFLRPFQKHRLIAKAGFGIFEKVCRIIFLTV